MSAELTKLRRDNDILSQQVYRLERILDAFRKRIQDQDTKICDYEYQQLEKELEQCKQK